MMQDFIRIGKYVWPYRRLFVWSVICAIIVSAFWALNLSIAFPVVKVLFQNDSLHDYVDSEIAALETAIRSRCSFARRFRFRPGDTITCCA